MEEQVISRAHRMGATRPIFVETLAMRGTIEEQMLKLLQVRFGSHRFVTFHCEVLPICFLHHRILMLADKW